CGRHRLPALAAGRSHAAETGHLQSADWTGLGAGDLAGGRHRPHSRLDGAAGAADQPLVKQSDHVARGHGASRFRPVRAAAQEVALAKWHARPYSVLTIATRP